MRLIEPNYKFDLISIRHIHPDINQPRKDVRNDERGKLVASIQKYGIEIPLSVVDISDKQFNIIDGHRRYYSAKDIGLKRLPCRVYQKMTRGDLESRRFEIQNNRKNWRPIEKGGAFKKIKELLGFKTNRQLADHLHVSETSAANSLQLMTVKIDYLEMMKEYALAESYQTEFMRLQPKLRRVKDVEAEEIIEIIFKKVKDKVIKTSRDFRTLGKVFSRAATNEREIYKFLRKTDESVEELIKRTSQSGLALMVEELIAEITERKNKGKQFSQKDEGILNQLAVLLSQTI